MIYFDLDSYSNLIYSFAYIVNDNSYSFRPFVDRKAI